MFNISNKIKIQAIKFIAKLAIYMFEITITYIIYRLLGFKVALLSLLIGIKIRIMFIKLDMLEVLNEME